MKNILPKITFTLVAVLLAVQGYLFWKEYDGEAYATQGDKLSETTWLYERDILTLQVDGRLPKDFCIWKNGKRLEVKPTSDGRYVLEVKTRDLIGISGTPEAGVAAELKVSLSKGVFREKFYAGIFDYTGGNVTVGWFVEK